MNPSQWFDSARRFERQYADHLITRCQAIPWPGGTRVELNEYVPVRGLAAALVAHPRLLLTGASGQGKTTALVHLALTHARALAAGERSAVVPVLLSARDLAPDGLPDAAGLNRAIYLSDALMAQCPARFFAEAGAAGRLLLLIDDVDALPPGAVDAWLAEFRDMRIVAAADTAALTGWTEFSLPGFRDDEIQTLARFWSQDKAAEWVAALKKASVPRSLVSNPLTLTLLTRIWAPAEPLPTRRTPLFDAYAHLILRDADDSARLLEEVAAGMLHGPHAVNGFLARSHGFMRAGQGRKAEFIHDLWQAYFAARALRRAATPLSEVLADPRREEMIAFYAGLGDATACIEQLVAQGHLALAGRALAHTGVVPDALRDSVTSELVRRAWEGDAGALAALSEMNCAAAMASWAARLKDPDPLVRRRAVERLGGLRLDRAVEYLLPQLRDPNGDVRDAVVAALGRARTDRVVEPLLVALRGDPRVGYIDTRLRVAAARALGETGSPRAVTALVVDLQVGEPEVQAAAAEALKQITSPLMLKPLAGLCATGDEASRRYAAEILAIAGGAPLPAVGAHQGQ